MKPHKHAKLIKAWANGAEIQCKCLGKWEDELNPQWEECFEFRIKPEKEPDIVRVFGFRTPDGKPYELELLKQSGHITGKCLKVVWDGTTGELKSAEVLK